MLYTETHEGLEFFEDWSVAVVTGQCVLCATSNLRTCTNNKIESYKVIKLCLAQSWAGRMAGQGS